MAANYTVNLTPPSPSPGPAAAPGEDATEDPTEPPVRGDFPCGGRGTRGRRHLRRARAEANAAPRGQAAADPMAASASGYPAGPGYASHAGQPGARDAVTQPDGTKVVLHVRGGEKANWQEDLNGYTVVRTADGRYVYATAAQQELHGRRGRQGRPGRGRDREDPTVHPGGILSAAGRRPDGQFPRLFDHEDDRTRPAVHLRSARRA